jgi:hypothetical protein
MKEIILLRPPATILVRGELPARWEPQEEGVMSIAAGFPSAINTLFPTCDEVVNLTGLLETKVMSVSSGKQYSMRVK